MPYKRKRPRCGGRHNKRGQLLCDVTRTCGEPCKNPAMLGRLQCRIHGGKSLAGSEHPNYKHGRFSKYISIPDDFDRLTQIVIRCGDPLSLRGEIAWIDLQINQTSEELLEHQQSHRQKKARKADREIYRLIESRRKLCLTEVKREAEMRQRVTVEEAMVLLGVAIGAANEAVKRHVRDPEVHKAVRREMNQYITKRIGDGGRLSAAELFDMAPHAAIHAIRPQVRDELRHRAAPFADLDLEE